MVMTEKNKPSLVSRDHPTTPAAANPPKRRDIFSALAATKNQTLGFSADSAKAPVPGTSSNQNLSSTQTKEHQINTLSDTSSSHEKTNESASSEAKLGKREENRTASATKRESALSRLLRPTVASANKSVRVDKLKQSQTVLRRDLVSELKSKGLFLSKRSSATQTLSSRPQATPETTTITQNQASSSSSHNPEINASFDKSIENNDIQDKSVEKLRSFWDNLSESSKLRSAETKSDHPQTIDTRKGRFVRDDSRQEPISTLSLASVITARLDSQQLHTEETNNHGRMQDSVQAQEPSQVISTCPERASPNSRSTETREVDSFVRNSSGQNQTVKTTNSAYKHQKIKPVASVDEETHNDDQNSLHNETLQNKQAVAGRSLYTEKMSAISDFRSEPSTDYPRSASSTAAGNYDVYISSVRDVAKGLNDRNSVMDATNFNEIFKRIESVQEQLRQVAKTSRVRPEESPLTRKLHVLEIDGRKRRVPLDTSAIDARIKRARRIIEESKERSKLWFSKLIPDKQPMNSSENDNPNVH